MTKGERHNKLTAERPINVLRWRFRCDCGATVDAFVSFVVGGVVKSCGHCGKAAPAKSQSFTRTARPQRVFVRPSLLVKKPPVQKPAARPTLTPPPQAKRVCRVKSFVYRPELNEAFEKLAFAIVQQACSDYRDIYRHLPPGENHDTASVLYELRGFFLSPWFEAIAGVDGADFLEQLQSSCARREAPPRRGRKGKGDA